MDDVRQGRVDKAEALLTELEAAAARTSWMRWISELRLAAAAAEHWMARGDCDRADEHAQRLARIADGLGSRDYRCAAERVRTAAALARGAGLEAAADRLGTALVALKRTPAPLEGWKSARMLAVVRHRLGDADGARRALAEAAADVDTIAAGTRDAPLRESFLRLPAVSEVRAGRISA